MRAGIRLVRQGAEARHSSRRAGLPLKQLLLRPPPQRLTPCPLPAEWVNFEGDTWVSLQRDTTRAAAVGMGLQVGGAVGNVMDRLLLGGATDVIYLGRGPVWNLADVALMGGALLATWALCTRR